MNRIEYDGPGELWIGGIRSVREEPTNQFDTIVTVCQDRVDDNVSSVQTYHYFCMSDGPDNEYGGDYSYELFSDAADTVRSALESGETVLVHCHVGRSRSVSVSMAALGAMLDIPRHEAYDIIERYRPQAHPDTLLAGHASTYIEEVTGRSRLPFGDSQQ